jgi:hypothetical protein
MHGICLLSRFMRYIAGLNLSGMARDRWGLVNCFESADLTGDLSLMPPPSVYVSVVSESKTDLKG